MKDNKNPYNYFGVPPPVPPGIVLESADIIHGENCDCCTSKKDSQLFAEEYERKIKELHKGRYKGVRALKAKKREEKLQQQQADSFAIPKKDEPDLLGDIGPI